MNLKTQWCDYIEEVTKITKVNPNKCFESSASLNQSRFPFRICDVLLPQDQNASVFFEMSQEYTSHVHIGSTLCLITTPRKYNAGVYASGTDIAIHLRPFVLISYISGFRNYRQMVEYAKDKFIDQNHHDVLQWARNGQNIIHYDNKLKLSYLLRE